MKLDGLGKIEKFLRCTFKFHKMQLDGFEKKSPSLGRGGGPLEPGQKLIGKLLLHLEAK